MILKARWPVWLLVTAWALAVMSGASAHASEVVLQDDQLLAAFDTDSGALTRLEDKTTHWVIERRPELGVPFRMLAPLPGRRYNFAWGAQQHASTVTKISAQQVRIQWQNLPTEHGGALPIVFTATASLTNGQLTFEAVLEDNSEVPVETVEYPYLGDLNPPARDSTFTAHYVKDGKNGGPQADELYPHFNNEKGYWGDFYPTKMLETTPGDLYCLLQATNEGICVAMKTPKLPYRLEYYFEQKPGLISSVNQLVPQGDEIGGTPVHLEFRTCHFVFAAAHSSVTLVPVIITCYHGDGPAGVKLYQQLHAAANVP
jgi:hypothetical protein